MFDPTNLLLGVSAAALISVVFYKATHPNRVYSVEVGEKKKGETRIRRFWKTADTVLERPNDSVNTLYELMSYSAQKRPNKKAFGTRPLVKVHTEEKDVKNAQGVVEKKKWTYLELGKYQYKTYQEVFDIVKQLGTALTSEKFGSLKKGSMLGIYAETSEQWLTFAHGAFSQGMVIVTIYANLGEDGLIYSLNDTSLTHLLTEASLLGSLLKVVKQIPKIKYVFYTDHRETADAKLIQSFKDLGITVTSYSEFAKIASEMEPKPQPPKAEDLAVIMYTSGTTGNPKGVMISHHNIVGALAGAVIGVGNALGISEGDTYCSFLPLAHILEIVVEHTIMFCGGTLAFGSPRTMTDNLVKNCKGDLAESRPTLMAGVPVLWERIRKGALDKIKTQPALTQKVFHLAFSIKAFLLSWGISNAPVLDQVIFSKFKDTVGGKLRGLVSGGAPLSHSTHQFLRVVFNVPALQGYGLTETTGLLACQPVDLIATEIVGAPFPCSEIKLVDVSEMGYTSEDKPFPRGEIWARGSGITLGYYNQPEKTKEEFKEGGWFATGDIAQWNANGTISIIDRKKNLVKLSHGEYIALEAMESKYKQDHFVEEICIVANSQRDLPAAIVVPNRKTLTAWGEENGVDTSDWDKLCDNDKARDAVKKSLHATATKEKMKNFEKPSGVYLTSDEWNVESGLVTAAMKLKRNEIQKNYKEQIDKLFPANN